MSTPRGASRSASSRRLGSHSRWRRASRAVPRWGFESGSRRILEERPTRVRSFVRSHNALARPSRPRARALRWRTRERERERDAVSEGSAHARVFSPLKVVRETTALPASSAADGSDLCFVIDSYLRYVSSPIRTTDSSSVLARSVAFQKTIDRARPLTCSTFLKPPTEF